MEGIIGKKIGMSRIFNQEGQAIPVTVVEAGPCPVVQVKTDQKEGYNAIQLGFGEKRKIFLPFRFWVIFPKLKWSPGGY